MPAQTRVQHARDRRDVTIRTHVSVSSSACAVGARPAIANAIVDALWHLGVRHIDIPITPQKVWRLLRSTG